MMGSSDQNLREAIAALKRYGKLEYRGVSFVEAAKIYSGKQEECYTGLYLVSTDNEVVTPESVSLAEAFRVGKQFFL